MDNFDRVLTLGEIDKKKKEVSLNDVIKSLYFDKVVCNCFFNFFIRDTYVAY